MLLLFEKRPGTIVSWAWFGFCFAFPWPFQVRVSPSQQRAVLRTTRMRPWNQGRVGGHRVSAKTKTKTAILKNQIKLALYSQNSSIAKIEHKTFPIQKNGGEKSLPDLSPRPGSPPAVWKVSLSPIVVQCPGQNTGSILCCRKVTWHVTKVQHDDSPRNDLDPSGAGVTVFPCSFFFGFFLKGNWYSRITILFATLPLSGLPCLLFLPLC